MRSNLASILSAASLASSGLAWPRPRPSSGTRSSAASAGRCSGAPRRCTTCQRQYSAHDSYPKRRRPSATAMAATGERSQGPWPQQHRLPLATASLLLRGRTAAPNDGRPVGPPLRPDHQQTNHHLSKEISKEENNTNPETIPPIRVLFRI